MSVRASFAALCWVALLGALAACGNNNNSGPAFPFQRAEHMQFTCFAPLAADDTQYVGLPAHCCKLFDPSDKGNPLVSDAGVDALNAQGLPGLGEDGGVQVPPECRYGNIVTYTDAGTDPGAVPVPIVTTELVGTPPALHALVTQSTRGEVAAVDLVNDRVLDSDRETPGFTFLDTGGLPTAIVVPSQHPRVVQPAGEPPVVTGPQWTYVTNAEQGEIRALATCRFRSGGACGPDSAPFNAGPGYASRTHVPLPATPRDMILGPGPTGPDQALFVTLPDLGLIARVELAETATVPVTHPLAGGPTEVALPLAPFALDAAGTKPNDPIFFRVPVPDVQTLGAPVSEASEYTAMCGFGYPYQAPILPQNLPLAPRSPPSNQVQPNLMHVDPETGLLLVTDRVAPVLHVFRFASDGTLDALPALPTGTAVQDFVITPRVPDPGPVNLAPPPPDPVTGVLPLPVALPEDLAAETKRYLYAIDERGTLALFDFRYDVATASVSLQPLLVPQPGVTYADRLDLPTPVTALDVIDTRSQSDYQCGELYVDTLSAQHADADMLPHGSYRDAVFAQINARRTLYDNADSEYIRGVFLAAASANGTLSLIDIHDLDVYCRARKFCCNDDTCSKSQLDEPHDSSQRQAVAVRRHSVRRASLGLIETVVPNSTLVQSTGMKCSMPGEPPAACQSTAAPLDVRCAPSAVAGTPGEPVPGLCKELPYRPVDDFLCMPADPWYALSETWAATWHGSIPNTQTTGASIEKTGPTTAIIRAPSSMNFCDLGVLDHDFVAVLGKAPDRLRSSCPDPKSADAALLEVVRAHDTYLEVRTPQYPNLVKESTQRAIDDLVRCYPDSIGIEMRARTFLVTGLHAPFLHRVITKNDDLDDNGAPIPNHCGEDPCKDELLTSRTSELDGQCADGRTLDDTLYPDLGKNPYRAQHFKNPYIEFNLTCGVQDTDNTFRNTGFQILQGSTSLAVTSVPSGNTTTDALPVLVRYEPWMGSVYVLDTASQGLRRYLLQPFAFDTNSFE